MPSILKRYQPKATTISSPSVVTGVYRIHPTPRDKAAMNGAPGYCLKTSIHYATLLPAECRVLVFKPGECVLKML